VAPAAARQSHVRISRFELAQREGLAILYGTVLLSLLSLFLPAPIAPPMSEISLASAEARAPWFFLWVQELLKYGPPFTMGVLIPATVFTYFALIPYLFPPPQPHELGEWFPKSGRIVQISSALILLALLWFTILALRSAP